MENQPQQGLVEMVSDKVWKFFSSVKLAVVLLIILAVVSVIGTVIQQNQPHEEYLREYSLESVQLFEALGFFDLHHTWWFVLPAPVHGKPHHLHARAIPRRLEGGQRAAPAAG